ncbi:MAG: APC family permease [Actinomycetota bacterium]
MGNLSLKRVLVGRPISTYEESQHRLPKRIALAVFSSDALSSSAYATDEILLALAAAGSAALAFSIPIGFAVATVLAIVIASYRQTVRAYPSGGGAYIVAHDNLGAFPGLIAASALLVDYVLTVAVSVAAGLAAVSAAFPGVREQRVLLAVAIVGVISALNLRGLKESGTIFSIPTYGFLILMVTTILVGAYQVLTGSFEPYPEPHITAEQGLTLFLILRAFASGSTALTGVEAISNGVPAFRKPEAQNAATTLLTLGALLAFLFLGITFLAHAFQVDPHLIEEGKTVPSQIAAKVFGPASLLFYLVQAFTALILFLAANTSFADFPRLASILAKDRYLPRALQNRGDRLAFSNGIVILAVAASGLLFHYRAEVHQIIPLYVIGVFTSFTLSQTGMVKHWFKDAQAATRLGRPQPRGWRRAAAINAVGATTTAVVLVVVSVTKFRLGAWQVMVLIPALAWILDAVRAHFVHVAEELQVADTSPPLDSSKMVLALTRKEGATKALALTRTMGPRDLRVVALATSQPWLAQLRLRWGEMGIRVEIEPIGRGVKQLETYVRSMEPTREAPVTLILPDPQYRSMLRQLAETVLVLRIKRTFLFDVETVVVSVPFRPGHDPEPQRLQAPGRFALIVFVSSVNKATLRAMAYAASLHPSALSAMSIQTLPGEAAVLTEQWVRWEIDAPVEIVDSPYRSLMEPVLREVRKLLPNPNDAVGVVVPEFVVKHWWEALLHNQTAFLIKSALLFEPNVVVINVPFRLGNDSGSRTGSQEQATAEV